MGKGTARAHLFAVKVSILELWRSTSVQSLQIRVYCWEQTGRLHLNKRRPGLIKKSSRIFWSKPAPSRRGPEYCVDFVGGRDKVASDDAFAIGTSEAGEALASRFDPHDR